MHLREGQIRGDRGLSNASLAATINSGIRAYLLTAMMLLTCFRFSILLWRSVTRAEGRCERTLMFTSMGLHHDRERSASLQTSVSYASHSTTTSTSSFFTYAFVTVSISKFTPLSVGLMFFTQFSAFSGLFV